MKEISEADMVEAIRFAHEAIKAQCRAIIEFAELNGSKKKREYSHETHDEELKKKVWDATYHGAYSAAKACITNKHERGEAFKKIVEDFIQTFPEEERTDEKVALIEKYYHEVEWTAVRRLMLDEKTRLDGRRTDEIRPIWCEVDYLPAAHGSALFTRGETQSLTTVTLGTKLDMQTIDGAVFQGENNFLLHYNFPPFSTGEVKMMRGPGRREVGHGNLALRALKCVFPKNTPYAVRVVSDILESNGSSSMATVCAGCLALMDSGIKILKPVSGIAMGLITDTDSPKYTVLSDILGDEDHLGDMDFKVCGTKDGITACQMDLKVHGLSYEIMAEALEQARKGRLHILDKMTAVLAEPRPDYKPHAPRIVQLTIDKEFIGAVIGPGGKIIQEMQRETGTTIVIEEVDGVGVVDIFSDNQESLDKAVEKIKAITAVPVVGEIYSGKVTSIKEFGAFVEILPGREGLLHISEVEWRRLKSLDGILKEGDTVEVKLLDVDQRSGKLKLSRKVLLPRPEKEHHSPHHKHYQQ
jgi:polyribonucleotide nucleotidyltransferase